MLVRGRSLGVFHLHLSQWRDEKARAALESVLGITLKTLADENAKYLLVNREGDLLCFGDKSAFDPQNYGIRFLEGPSRVSKAEEVLVVNPEHDEYEHTFFVCYNGAGRVGLASAAEGKGVLLNCFRKLFAEVSYELQEVCTFVELEDPAAARELGIDPTQPGLIHVLHSISPFNRSMFPADGTTKKLRERAFSVSHRKELEPKALEARFGAPYRELNAKHFEEIYPETKNLIFDALCQQRKVLYCPNPGYLRLYVPFFKDKRERVLYVAANPIRVGLEEFQRLYKTLAEFAEKHPQVRVVVTDLPNAADFTFILPEDEKFTIRYIDYGHFYSNSPAGEKPAILALGTEAAATADGLKCIEKYRLDSPAEPTADSLGEFVAQCEQRTVAPYRESEPEPSTASEDSKRPTVLTARNYQTVLDKDAAYDRVVVCYCARCVKCQQTLEGTRRLCEQGSGDAKVYLYNMGNESELNSRIREAPMLLFFPKGSKVPTKSLALTEILVSSQNTDKPIAESILGITR